MIKYLVILFLLFSSYSKGQDSKYLDTIPKEKRALLLKYKTLFAVETLAGTTISSFRKHMDSIQKDTSGMTYTLLDLKANRLKKVPFEVIKSMDKKDFSAYLLQFYSKALAYKDLKPLDSFKKTKKGRILLDELQQVYEGKINLENHFGSIFNDIQSYDYFMDLHEKIGAVYHKMAETLFAYIDEKVRIYTQTSIKN